jgi:hypothetical protein
MDCSELLPYIRYVSHKPITQRDIMLNRLIVVLLCSFPSYVLADGVPLDNAVNTIMIGGDVLAKVMWAACIIVGIALIAAAFTQFQIHRRNPKLVPLTTPIMYLILGVASIAIPFLDRVTDFLNPTAKPPRIIAPAPTKGGTGPVKPHYDPNDIDAPIR